jgi:hypothetical protein
LSHVSNISVQLSVQYKISQLFSQSKTVFKTIGDATVSYLAKINLSAIISRSVVLSIFAYKELEAKLVES